jgi:predicted Zn-ribbon and HTH transcriptional regulator
MDPVPERYCHRCGHLWIPRKAGVPRLCSRCKSSQWNVPIRRDAVCGKCGNEWCRTEINEPCPECGLTGREGTAPEALRCNQCDHEWIKRSAGQPKRCPVCKTSKWNETKVPQQACHRCGHVFRIRTESPLKCPKCQSAKWNIPAYKLQCRRCGHRWISRGERRSDEVRICPSCKSGKWNETPKLMMCESCGTYYINRSDKGGSRCPSCSKGKKSFRKTCDFCKSSWNSTADGWTTCPRCGKPRSGAEDGRTFEMWSDGVKSLRYVHADDLCSIYLWDGNTPLATMYFHDLLNRMDITAEQFGARLSDQRYERDWMELAEHMHRHRDDYKENIPYLMKRLNICEFDATVLAIHFTGMGPEAIAVRFDISPGDVRKSFDRIMAAYADSGIVVNDSLFTDDPMSLY